MCSHGVVVRHALARLEVYVRVGHLRQIRVCQMLVAHNRCVGGGTLGGTWETRDMTRAS